MKINSQYIRFNSILVLAIIMLSTHSLKI